MFHRSVPIHLNDSLIAEDMLHRFENGPKNPEGNERANSSLIKYQQFKAYRSSAQSLIYRQTIKLENRVKNVELL